MGGSSDGTSYGTVGVVLECVAVLVVVVLPRLLLGSNRLELLLGLALPGQSGQPGQSGHSVQPGESRDAPQ